MKEKYNARNIAQLLGCSVQLIYKKCYSFGLKFRDKFYTGCETDLQEEIISLHRQYPNSGSEVKLDNNIYL